MNARLVAASLLVVSCGLAGTLVAAQSGPTGDWPQWRGVERNGVSRETGLLQQWPDAGPAVGWTATGLGSGYGSLAVQGNRVFVQGLRNGQSIVHSLDRATGKYVWSKNLGPGGDNDRGPGPRSTPTLDGERMYVLTESGQLACLRAEDGTMIWQRHLIRDFGGRNPYWLLSESPLVDGDRVVVTPGGRGAGMVALDKLTGRTLWTAKELSDEPGYSSVMPVDVGGVRAYTTLTAEAGVGVRASDGKVLWRYRQAANGTANITSPVVSGSQVFYSSAYGTGGGLVNIVADGAGGLRADEVYFTRDMQNHHGGVVLVNGTLYGYNNSILTALDFATGRMLWRHRAVGKGSVAYADGRLYMVGEDHVVGLAEVTPTGYRETGRFSIQDQGWPSWAHPVVAGGRLYIRNQGTLTAYVISAR